MNPKNLIKYFQNRQPKTCDLIREMVDIESPSYDHAARRRVVNLIEERLLVNLPAQSSEKIFAEGYGEHLLIRAYPQPANKKPILILGHTDTVHPKGSKERNPTRIESGRLYGCGTFDMKANIALLVEIFGAIREFDLRPANPLTILLTCDEEVGSPTGRVLVETEAAASEKCLVFEPSKDGMAKTGRKGGGIYRLSAHGIAAHAGLDPEKGSSAILEISRQVERLQAMNDFEKGTTVNVGTIEGGTVSNVIPEHASCEIDVRFNTVAEAHRIENEIINLQAFDQRATIDIVGRINRPPLERTARVLKLYEEARLLAATFDYELGETQVGGGSDGNLVDAIGVPVLDGLGVSGDGAHTMHEYISIEDIPLRATLLTLLLLNEKPQPRVRVEN